MHPTHTVPFEHQTRIYEQSGNMDAFALLMEPGTGKTKLTLDTAMHRYASVGDVRTLIAWGPNGGHRVWPEQAKEHWAPDVPTRTVLYHAGMTKKEQRAAADAVMDPKSLLLVAVNIEAMSSYSGQEFVAQIIKNRQQYGVMGAVDESHKIKSPGARRTKALLKLREHLRVRRILTGTPLAKGYENLDAQFRFLDPAIIGCKTHTEFKAWFCVERRFDRWTKIVGYRNIDILLEKIGPYMATQKLDDCADMPGRLPPQIRYTALSEEQRRVYAELRDECLTVLDSGQIIDEQMMMVRMLRLQQVLSGFIGHKDADGNKVLTEFPSAPRVEACLDEIEQAPGQVIVWCKFKYDIERLTAACRAEEISCTQYYGGISDAQCDANLTRFKTDPSVKVIFMTPAKGSESHTILQGTTVIWYSHTWSYLQRKQANDRAYRLGQKEHVRYIDLVSENTLEERMLKNTEKTGELTATVFTASFTRSLLEAA